MEFPKFYSVGLKNSLMLQMNPLSYGFVNEMLFPEIIEQKNIRDTFWGTKKIVNENFISSRVCLPKCDCSMSWNSGYLFQFI